MRNPELFSAKERERVILQGWGNELNREERLIRVDINQHYGHRCHISFPTIAEAEQLSENNLCKLIPFDRIDRLNGFDTEDSCYNYKQARQVLNVAQGLPLEGAPIPVIATPQTMRNEGFNITRPAPLVPAQKSPPVSLKAQTI